MGVYAAGEVAVAQLALYAPESSLTTTSGPFVKLGGSFTAATVIYVLVTLIVVFGMRRLEQKVAVPGLISAGGAPMAGH